MSDDNAPQTARSGLVVPGYTGYVPGKVPEMANMGKRFALSNMDGITSARGEGMERSAPKVTRGAHRTIPGYSGWIPNKVEDTYAATWAVANARGAAEEMPLSTPRHEVRPGDWHPANTGARTEEAVRSQQSVMSPRTAKERAHFAVPGYTGHVPGKTPEDVIGARFAAANARAVADPDVTNGQKAWRRASAPNVAHHWGQGASPGKSVPGYTGYVHGKRPEADVMGMTFKVANHKSDEARIQDNTARTAVYRSQASRPETAPGRRKPTDTQSVSSSQASSPQKSSQKRSNAGSSRTASDVGSRRSSAAFAPPAREMKPPKEKISRAVTPTRQARPAPKYIPGYGGYRPQNHEWV